jgi:hypothetical protein
MKLYEIKEEFLRLMELDLDEQTMKDTLESLTYDLEDKVDNIACVIKSLEAESDAIKTEADKLLERAKKKAKNAQDLKDYLFNTLKTLNINKIETIRNVLSVKKNPVSVVVDEGFNDSDYMTEKISYTIDKKAIKSAIETGIEVKGARLEQKERLEVK